MVKWNETQLTHVIGIVQSRGLLSHHTGFMSKLVLILHMLIL